MKLRITIEGRVYEVEVDMLEGAAGQAATPLPVAPVPTAPPPPQPAPAPAPAPAPPPAAAPKAGGKTFPAPLAGTVRKVLVGPGDAVKKDQKVIVLEAMKMETDVFAPADGTVTTVLVKEGDSVQAGTPLIEFA